jgi:hypothetical protein
MARPKKKPEEKFDDILHLPLNERLRKKLVRLARISKTRYLTVYLRNAIDDPYRSELSSLIEELRSAVQEVKKSDADPFIKETALFSLKEVAKHILQRLTDADKR